jgi:hypothetical protein
MSHSNVSTAIAPTAAGNFLHQLHEMVAYQHGLWAGPNALFSSDPVAFIAIAQKQALTFASRHGVVPVCLEGTLSGSEMAECIGAHWSADKKPVLFVNVGQDRPYSFVENFTYAVGDLRMDNPAILLQAQVMVLASAFDAGRFASMEVDGTINTGNLPINPTGNALISIAGGAPTPASSPAPFSFRTALLNPKAMCG